MRRTSDEESLPHVIRPCELSRHHLPHVLPQLEGYQIAAWNMQAEQAGGDTYDVIGLSQPTGDDYAQLALKKADIAVFLLADATGHGIGPALLATAAGWLAYRARLDALLAIAVVELAFPLHLLAGRIRNMRIYDGPSEVHRMVIARNLMDTRP